MIEPPPYGPPPLPKPDPDLDLTRMGEDELRATALAMRRAIRAHRDSEGHKLCWFVPELWDLLPDKKVPAPRVPPRGEFLHFCAKYRDSLGS